jgi:prevent-host-death family protein
MASMGADAAEQFNIHEAKTQLSRIIERVEKGEQVVISRAGVPVAKVVPFPTRANRHGRGSLAGQIELSDDWDSPEINAQIAADFGSPE